MISEKRLAYYEYMASKADEATAKAIEQLIAEVRRLEKEADSLAEMGVEESGCPSILQECWRDANGNADCKKCWREAARKAVKNG